MKRLEFTVPGCPVPYQRTGGGKGGRRFTPPKSRAYRANVSGTAIAVAFRDGWIDGSKCARETVLSSAAAARKCACPWCSTQYTMIIHAYFPDLRTRDLDNVAKSVCDALNKVLYRDDGQIAELHVSRHLDRDNPRAEIQIVTVPK